MSLGTTLKIGWDANEVKQGFATLRTMFAGSIRGLRQVGIGAARQIGAGMTDLLGRAIMAVPQGIQNMLEWTANMADMSNQTGVAVSKLVVLEEALRLAGAESGDTSRVLSTLNRNLYEAGAGMGPARDALHKLGLTGKQFRDLALDESFKVVGTAIADFKGKSGELESIMAELFGARMGYKLIRFFKDYNAGMKQAEKNVGTQARHTDKMAESFGKLDDAMGRLPMLWRSIMAVIVEQAEMYFGDGFLDRLIDGLNPDKLRQTMNWAREEIMGINWEDLGTQIGERIGKGVENGIWKMIPKNGLIEKGLNFMDISRPKSDGDSAAVRELNQIHEGIMAGNRYLQKIETHRYGWA